MGSERRSVRQRAVFAHPARLYEEAPPGKARSRDFVSRACGYRARPALRPNPISLTTLHWRGEVEVHSRSYGARDRPAVFAQIGISTSWLTN